jgi:hypothetical protein
MARVPGLERWNVPRLFSNTAGRSRQVVWTRTPLQMVDCTLIGLVWKRKDPSEWAGKISWERRYRRFLRTETKRKTYVLQQRLNGNSDVRGRILSGYEIVEDFYVRCLKFFCALWRYESRMTSSSLKYWGRYSERSSISLEWRASTAPSWTISGSLLSDHVLDYHMPNKTSTILRFTEYGVFPILKSPLSPARLPCTILQ